MAQKTTVQEALIEYREALQTFCADQIERLILFGSRARGNATPESDIDILVVVNWDTQPLPGGFYTTPFSDPRWQKIIDIAYDVSLNYNVYLSPLVISEREFYGWSPLVRRVKAEGIEIWNRNVN